METKKSSSGFWWLKQKIESPQESLVPELDLKSLHDSSSSFTDLLQINSKGADVDVGTIIEEINRVAAQSPLGPFNSGGGERSIEDIMKETEKVYMESSRSFEQLSQRSKTSQNISDLLSSDSKLSTPTPKSVSPLPMDPGEKLDDDYSSDYSEDFSQSVKISEKSSKESQNVEMSNDALKEVSKSAKLINLVKNSFRLPLVSTSESPRESPFVSLKSSPVKTPTRIPSPLSSPNPKLRAPLMRQQSQRVQNDISKDSDRFSELHDEIEIRNKLISTLEEDNGLLKKDMAALRQELEQTRSLVEKFSCAKTLTSPEINLELDKALEELKDYKEINTSLQLQLDTANKTHQLLKGSYDDLLSTNRNLERKMVEMDSALAKYKAELVNVQQTKTKLLENEMNMNKLLEIEKLQSKSLKLQNEKDSKCIQDLNRQIKEMERIIARKHPDSVSALIVAAKEDATETNLTARKLLEDRIKTLEQEVTSRDSQSSKVFLEIQDKFSQMKNKYESHIEDLELHVSDLKKQLTKNRTDTYDVYTQTFFDERVPQKEKFTIGVQTEAVSKPKIGAKKTAFDRDNFKEDAHLLATIRGLQTDLANKEKVIVKLQKEIEEVRKTNKRLQKEREGSLRNLSRSYPEKLANQSRAGSVQDFRKEEELQQVKLERDRLKQQLSRLEDDFQNLKKKRLDDLTALQGAHEREIETYVASVTPLREQLELQQVSIGTLQEKLAKAKEELAVVTADRDHLTGREGGGSEVDGLLKKISFLEKRYEERELRLRAIVQSLAQKSVTNRSCEQCADRQQQLIGYKVELDQLLATVRALK